MPLIGRTYKLMRANKILILLNRKGVKMITTQQLLDEMHLDKSETQQIESLIDFAQNYIVSTTAKGATIEDVIAKTNEKIFEQATKSLVTSLYFGSVEQSGFGVQSMVLLNAIRNMYQGA